MRRLEGTSGEIEKGKCEDQRRQVGRLKKASGKIKEDNWEETNGKIRGVWCSEQCATNSVQ